MGTTAPHRSPVAAWAETADATAARLEVDLDRGLDAERIERRRARHGRNRLRGTRRERTIMVLARQFRSLIMFVLLLACLLSIAFGHWIDGAAIAVAILVNAGIGFVTELRALRSMEALQRLDRRTARVRREGEVTEIDAEEIVPGDLVLVEAGDVVPADLRIAKADDLHVDESALSGESLPVAKSASPVDTDTPLAERTPMLHKGTAITRGSGLAIAVATGMRTELGDITSLVQEAEAESDPLSRRLDRLAAVLVRAILVVSLIAGGLGLLLGRPLLSMVETSVALFVAAVPEGLPVVATLALARGLHRMARRHALVRRLSAVQTLGSTNVILTDKTGTLTENRMTATLLCLPDRDVEVRGSGLDTTGRFEVDGRPVDPREDPGLERAIETAVLCTTASLASGSGDASRDGEAARATGDPTEIALLVLGAKAEMDHDGLVRHAEEVKRFPFDPAEKRMATVHRRRSRLFAAVKGAPDAVLDRCSSVQVSDGAHALDAPERERWEARNHELASSGHRVLALARRDFDEGTDVDDVDVDRDLTLLGLVALRDPVREDVAAPLAACRDAGIRFVMVTGDQEETAVAVADSLGLIDDEHRAFAGESIRPATQLDEAARDDLLEGTVFYRATPRQKLDLIELHRQRGSIVGMTGDGVNDAPALKKADIGIAMGERGEQVAEDAADVILQDDRLATIVMAVEQGRVIHANVRTFVSYMISGNVGEILLVLLATLLALPLPLLPLQILYINVVNDIFPALALGVGPGSGREMQRPPRDPREPILSRRDWWTTGVLGLVVGLPVLGGFVLCLEVMEMPTEQAVTVSFLSIAFARLWHAFNFRDRDSEPWRNRITSNAWLWAAFALCTVLLVLAVQLPILANVLDVTPPDATTWSIVLAISVVPLLLGQTLRALRWV